MATRPVTANFDTMPNLVIFEWTGLLNTDDGAPAIPNIGMSEVAVQVDGTWGTGGTLLIEQSIDGVAWGTMILANNNSASFTSSTSATIRGTPRLIRPRVSAGNSSTNLRCLISFASAKPLS